MSELSRSAAALFCAGMMLLPVSAVAASHGTPAERFQVIDANKDGLLSWAEFQAASPNISEQGFKMMDTGGDGNLDQNEWNAFMSNHGIKSPSAGGGMGGMGMSGMGGMGMGGGAGMPPMGMMGEMPHDQGNMAPAPAGQAPLIMPPSSEAAPSASGAPLIMPPASASNHDHSASAAPASSAPLIMPPQE